MNYLINLPHTSSPGGGSDEEDFVDNYKDAANAPLNLGEDKIVDALEIRDTSDHNSEVSDNRGFVPKTIMIENGLDQTASCQVQVSRDSAFTNPVDCGDSFDVSASTDSYQTITDYFPFFRVVLTCASAPTTGAITIYFEKVKT